jgi:hypothetical protein
VLVNATYGADPTPMDRTILELLPKYQRPAEPAVLPRPPAVQPTAGPRLPAVVYVTPPPPAATRPTLMAPVIVTAPKARPKLVPQLKVTPPVKDVKIDPMFTDEAKGEALIKKHLTYLDSHILNQWIMPGGVTNLQRAQQAEAIEQSRKGLNSVADDIDLTTDPAERKHLKEMYEELYMSRPR